MLDASRSKCLVVFLALGAMFFALAPRVRAGVLEPFIPDNPQPQASPGIAAASAAIAAPGGPGGSSFGGLPQTSTEPNTWRLGLNGGEYQIASVGLTLATGVFAVSGRDQPNVSVAVDGRLVLSRDLAPDATLRVGCRYQPAGSSYNGYALSFAPSQNSWSLDRFDQGAVASLTGIQYLNTAPTVADIHHLRLTCSGSTLSASVDGIQLTSVQDGAYQDGDPMLGVGTFTREGALNPAGGAYAGTLDARFSNLVLTAP